MKRRKIAVACLVLCSCSAGASAQLNVYLDDESSSSCDLVNASNTELAVLYDTQELVIIEGQDVVLIDTFVDCDGTVFVDGESTGFVEYAFDGDGFRTLWWLSDLGTAMEFDFLSSLPFDSGLFPSDFVGVPCDACDQWDAFTCASVVADFDRDGIADFLDLCCDTPIDALEVDADGCEVVIVIIDDFDAGGGTNLTSVSVMCGSFSTLSLAMMFAGLVSFRTRRWVR